MLAASTQVCAYDWRGESVTNPSGSAEVSPSSASYSLTDTALNSGYAGVAEATGSTGDTKANGFTFNVTNTNFTGWVGAAMASSYGKGQSSEASNNTLILDSGDGGLAAAAFAIAFAGPNDPTGSLTSNNNRLVAKNTTKTETFGARITLKEWKDPNTGIRSSWFDNVQASGNTVEFTSSSVTGNLAASAIIGQEVANLRDLTMSDNKLTVTGIDKNSRVAKSIGSALIVMQNLSPYSVVVVENGAKASRNALKASNLAADDIYTVHFKDGKGSWCSPQMQDNTLDISDATVTNGIGAVLLGGPTFDFSSVQTMVTDNSVTIRNVTVGDDGVYGAAYIGDFDRLLHGIDKDNSIFASGINSVGTIGGFDNLTLSLAEENKSENSNADGARAVIAITGSNKSVNFENRAIVLETLDGVSLKPNEVLNLISVTGQDSSVSFPQGFKMSHGDTFKITDYTVVGDGLTYNTGDTLGITLTEVTDPEDPPRDPEGGSETNPDDGNQGNWEVTTKPTDNAKTLAENYLGSAAILPSCPEKMFSELSMEVLVSTTRVPASTSTAPPLLRASVR